MITSTSSQQTHLSSYRSLIRGKTRILVAWTFAIFLGFVAREYPTWPGLVVCFLGATLRYWASGYLRKDTRPAVGGPYAWVRNPLYLGTYLMALGAVAAIEQWYVLAALTVVFAAVYHYIILDEETKLTGIFGQPYLTYCQWVPRFFPRMLPPGPLSREDVLEQINPEKDHRWFSSELAQKNKAYEAYLTFFALVAYLAGAAYVWKQVLG